jgi:hypothetical protein
MTMKKNTLWLFFTVVVGFLLSVDRLPLPINAQVIPPLSFFCALLLPLFLLRMRRTPLLTVILLFALFVLVYSAIAVFIDYVILGQNEIRVYAWLRQVFAFIAGVSVFFVLRTVLTCVPDRRLAVGILIGAVPALAVALANVIWGLTGSALCGAFVGSARSFLLGAEGLVMGEISTRAAGLSNEPASFAQFIVLILIPFAASVIVPARKRLTAALLMFIIIASFLWTFSTTGFTLLLLVAFLGIVLGPNRCLYFGLTLLPLLALPVILFKMRDNYMTAVLNELWATGTTATMVSKQYSTTGPILTSLDSYTLLGYGLGGSSAHFSQIIPEYAQANILNVSWEGMPTLKTLAGKIFAETGLPGVLLIFLVIILALRQIHRALAQKPQHPDSFLKGVRLALLGVIISFATGGSFATPFLWFWLAVVDSRYIRAVKNHFQLAS